MNNPIHKSAAVIIRNKKLLIAKHRNIEQWISVGGKIQTNETPIQALKREIKEELGVDVLSAKFYFTTLPEIAAGDKLNRQVIIELFLVQISGEPKPSNEIVELHWLSKNEYLKKKFDMASGLEKQIVPRLIMEKLI